MGRKGAKEQRLAKERKASRDRARVLETTNKALKCLKAAKADLDSARRWGIVDMIGGMYVISGIKLIKVESAKKHIREAMTYLQMLRNERDHTDYASKSYSRLGLVGMGADVGFDGVGPDIYAQFRIEGLRARVIKAIANVEAILREVEKAEFEKAEFEKAELEKTELEKAERDETESEKAELEKAESDEVEFEKAESEEAEFEWEEMGEAEREE